MLWLVTDTVSREVVSCNTHFNKSENIHEVWVESFNGNTVKIKSGTFEETNEIKDAIDYAIGKGEKVLRL